VLVVHDEPDGCELLVRILRASGYQAERAHDFLEMTAVLGRAERFDCVVLDVGTGGIGGNLKLLDAIRNHGDPVLAGTRVVMISAGANSAMFSWQAGIDEFVARPFHARDLTQAVAEAIARPEEDRPRHRRRQLDAASSAGRRSSAG
jgi:DNA-binding response OmpR family regulator